MRVRLPAVLRRPPVAVNTALVLLLAGGGWWAWLSVRGDAAADARPAGTRTVSVSRGTVTATVTADGSVRSASTATASFATAGTVTAVRVQVGDQVKKGQLLATVDPAAAQRDLDVAKADLTAAQDALDRAEAAGSDTSSAQTSVTQAELAVSEARAAVTGTRLTAPMAGTVVAVNGTVGSSSGGSATGGGSTGQQQGGSGSAGSGSTSASGFVELADLTKLQVTAGFAEADATRLKNGQTATITWNALPGAQAGGQVEAVDPQATTTNNVVTYGVTVSVDELPAEAKPGQTVRVSVVTGTAADVLTVSSAAISGTGDRRTATVLTETGQESRRVTVGLAGDQAYEVVSGLAEGDRVVLPQNTGTGTTGGGFPGGGRVPGGGGFPGGGLPGGGAGPGGGTRGGSGTR
ncbi:efflux RND transporter periplasmic adaptor subunit [Micromonospora wenchangensis]|uniref:efflux RND transporter periplasmic adaptor subunit n=1 Tax=Micromonospora wenchangensis TaxID=1185415 RepID=UPI003D73BBFB